MAETVATVLWEIGGSLATDAAITIAANAAYINAAAAFIASSAYGGYQKRKAASAARDAFNAGLEDRLVMTATAQAARSRIYGRVRNVDGVVFKATHGTNSEYYTLVVALAGHEVTAIETVYFDDVAVTLDGSGYVQTVPWAATNYTTHTVGGGASVNLGAVPVAGSVRMSWDSNEAMGIVGGSIAPDTLVGTVATFSGFPVGYYTPVTFQTSAVESFARVRAYTGAPGQDLYSVLQPLVGGAVTASDKFQGIACLVVTLKYSTDAFPGGVPQISAVMRGAKCTDWRTGTTAWTQNPAVIAYDWARYANGGGCSAAEIKQDALTTAANACDVSTSFSTPAGPEVRPLYQCGIAIPLDSNPDEALAEIVESMAGQWGWAGGQLTLRAGHYRAPVATITEDWITDADSISVVDTATADLVNIMRPSLADSANAYAVAPAADVRAAAYISADGRELVRELSLGGVTKAVHAQHVCGVLMRETREGLTVTLPCNLRAYVLEIFDVVTLVLPVFGWGAGKTFEVTGWEFSVTGGVQLTLRETAAGIYTPDSSFSLLTTSPNTRLPAPTVVPQVGLLTVASSLVAQADSSIISRTVVSWPAVASEAVAQSGSIEVQYTEVSATLPTGGWPTAAPVPGGATSTVIAGLRVGVAYAIRARAVSSLGVRGPWSLQAVHIVGGPRIARVYRQGTAPTGAQDGDTWQDTSTGIQYERVAGAWQAVVGSGSVGTGQLGSGAATEIAFDDYDFAGGSFGTTTARTVSFTPTSNCVIEFTATLVAEGVYPDGGHTVRWLATPSGGSTVYLGVCQTQNIDKQQFAASAAFTAVGGVPIDFSIATSRPFGDPNILLYLSKMRITAIKR